MKSNTSTRLINKTKIFLLAGLLAIPIIGGSFLLFNKSSVKNSEIVHSPTEQLKEQREQVLNQLQTQITDHSINEGSLLQTLKSHYSNDLNTNFTKLTDYLQAANSLEELTNRQTKIQQTINYLVSPNPGPTPSPVPPTPNPSPNPTPNPGPKPNFTGWEKVLNEIHNFLVKRPTSLAEIKQFAERYPDPLVGVDLKGMSNRELTKLGSSSMNHRLDDLASISPLDSEEFSFGGVMRKSKYGRSWGTPWKDYQKIIARGDGNCFFNSFSIFLVGNESLALRLRVAFCLYAMKNYEAYINNGVGYVYSEQGVLNQLYEHLVKERITVNGGWASNFDIHILACVLKKPIACIATTSIGSLTLNHTPNLQPQIVGMTYDNWDKMSASEKGDLFNKMSERMLENFSKKHDYPQFYLIWNSGNHFEPLIIPQY